MLNQNSLGSSEKLTFCGRVLSQAELDPVRQILTDFPFLSQAELAHTICELLPLRRRNGKRKSRACVEWLHKWQGQACLPPLPAWRLTQPEGAHRVPVDAGDDSPTLWHGPWAQYQPLQLPLITELSERRRFQPYLQRFHRLGYRVA